jgi:hypothetical protein
MSQFATRNTPIAGPLGCQEASLPGTTTLLSTLVSIPPGANAATVQGVGGGTYAYRLDGSEGEAATDCLSTSTLPMANREQITGAVLCSSGDATSVVVQFYTGRTGL